MELKRYLSVLWQWWWLGLVTFIATVLATLLFTYSQTPQYESETKMVVSPNSIIATDLGELRAAVTSLDKPIVANTYAEIAQSSSIVQAVKRQLGIVGNRDYEVSSSVLQETTIIQIAVTGPDPVIVQQLATQVALQTLEYVAGLYEVYDLTLLDPAALPTEPSSPNIKLNIVVGIAVAIGLAAIFAFLAEYMKAPIAQIENPSASTTEQDA